MSNDLNVTQDCDTGAITISVPFAEWFRVKQQLGFLEGVLLGLEFATTHEEFREALESAKTQYEEIKGGDDVGQ